VADTPAASSIKANVVIVVFIEKPHVVFTMVATSITYAIVSDNSNAEAIVFYNCVFIM
jgi:hypothetical protein